MNSEDKTIMVKTIPSHTKYDSRHQQFPDRLDSCFSFYKLHLTILSGTKMTGLFRYRACLLPSLSLSLTSPSVKANLSDVTQTDRRPVCMHVCVRVCFGRPVMMSRWWCTLMTGDSLGVHRTSVTQTFAAVTRAPSASFPDPVTACHDGRAHQSTAE